MDNFKVRCTEACGESVILGKIYEIKNGILTFEGGKFIGSYNNVEEINYDCNSQFELVTEPKSFTKADLKTGDVLVSRSGVLRKIIKGSKYEDFTITPEGFTVGLDNYDKDLNNKAVDLADTVKVFRPTYMCDILTFCEDNMTLLYQRPEPLKYTIAEAEAALTEVEGKPVEIVKE